MRWVRWLVVGLLVVGGAGCSDGGTDGGDGGMECRPDDVHRISFGQEDTAFFVGPYLGHTTGTSVAVGWETELEGSTVLEYGADESYGSSVEGEAGTMHQVVVAGLEPDTRYHYRACTDGICTSDLMFSTAPLPGQPFRFAVYGDTRSDPSQHRAVSLNIVADEPALVFNVGDIVADGNIREEFKQMHFDPTRLMGHYAPVYVAIGNHERKDTEGVHFVDYLMMPEDPDVPQPETSFSFVWGDAFFLVFDATLDRLDSIFFPIDDFEPPLWLWLNEQVTSSAAQNARWRFAFTHYPADSVCGNPEEYGWPEAAVREYIIPLLAQNGFQVYFAGHVHDYERFDFDGFLVFTTGGGGAGLDQEDSCHKEVAEARMLRCIHHHMTVDLGCDSAHIRAVDVDGRVFDQVTLHPDGSFEVRNE